jgi:hypothetical protein
MRHCSGSNIEALMLVVELTPTTTGGPWHWQQRRLEKSRKLFWSTGTPVTKAAVSTGKF